MTPDLVPAPSSSQRATAREFFAVVFRRRWIIIGLFVVTLGTVLIVSLGTPRSFVSSGQVLVRRGEQQSAMNPVRQVANEWEIELGNEIQTAKSWPVLQRAQKLLDEERRGQPAIKVAANQVGVEVTGKSNVLIIDYSDGDPRVAERACDALLRAYIDYRQSAQLTYPQRFFDREIKQAAEELSRWTELRREFANQTGMVDLPGQRTSLIFVRGNLEGSRAAVEGDLAEASSQYRLMGELQDNPDIDQPNLLQPTAFDATLGLVGTKVLEQKARIARLLELYRSDSPEVVNAQTTLDTLRGMLLRETQARYVIARARIQVARAKLEAIDRDIAAVDAKLVQMPDFEARVVEMDNQIATWKQRHTDLARNSDQARVNENTVPLISVFLLNPASPARPQNTQDYVRLGLAPAFSLVVGIGLAFFVDGLDLTIRTSPQAEEEVRLPVLAAVRERKRSGWRSRSREAEEKIA
jgi:succinoglycan biosynthesis transport protein ExoP